MSARLILLLSLITSTLAAYAGAASAQGERARQPAATTGQPNATTGQPQRRRERPANAQAQRRRANPPGRPARPAGGLNLELGTGNTTVNGATRGPGDSFAGRGFYATDAQMERYTGQREAPRPRMHFRYEEIDRRTGFPRGTLPGVQPLPSALPVE